MSQFDDTTKTKTGEIGSDAEYEWICGFKNGRNSTKASMEILARCLVPIAAGDFITDANASLDVMFSITIDEARKTIAQVKANGDWPLEE